MAWSKPSCLHTTSASDMEKLLEQTVPQRPPMYTSSLPLEEKVVEELSFEDTRRILPSERQQNHKLAY